MEPERFRRAPASRNKNYSRPNIGAGVRNVLSASEKQEYAEVARWCETMMARELPRDVYEMAFSKSQGPGGQNVNKLSTKAELRLNTNSRWLPA